MLSTKMFESHHNHVTEIASVTIAPEDKEAFVSALRRAAAEILPQATGFLGFTMLGWGTERPNVFVFTIAWETLEAHTVGFRESELFTQWREIIGGYFAEPPVVEHFSIR